MTVLKNFFSQWYKYVLWALLSVFFWGWIFTLLTDAPASKKLVVCVDAAELRDEAMADALSEHLPEGIRLVAVHPFDYYIFDTDELRRADLYIVSGEKAEQYIESFLPLEESGFDAAGRELWTQEGVAYGLGLDGAAGSYVGYLPGQSWYLFFGAEGAHRADGAAAALAEQIYSLP